MLHKGSPKIHYFQAKEADDYKYKKIETKPSGSTLTIQENTITPSSQPNDFVTKNEVHIPKYESGAGPIRRGILTETEDNEQKIRFGNPYPRPTAPMSSFTRPNIVQPSPLTYATKIVKSPSVRYAKVRCYVFCYIFISRNFSFIGFLCIFSNKHTRYAF